MIFFIIAFLQSAWGIKVPAAFTYYSTRMILATLTALLLSIFLGPFFIRKLYELKIGQSIRMEECPLLGKLHEKKKDTPTMGGILILFCMLASMALWMDFTHVFTWILLLVTVGLGMVGGWDDYLKLKYRNSKGITARKKLFFQMGLSGLLALYLLYSPLSEMVQQQTPVRSPIVKEQVSLQVQIDPSLVEEGKPSHQKQPFQKVLTLKDYAARLYIPFFKEPSIATSFFSLLLMALLIVFVITGSSNAVNLTDGLDGLAAGCLLMVASCLALIAFVSNHVDLASYLHILYIEGSGEIAIYLSAFVGACLGFLWYNGHPAQVFMGDTGSLSLGGIIGTSAVLLRKELLLAIIGGIFVAEALSVILQVGSYRLRKKKRIFLCAPLHHHFEYMGWAETKVVIRFWIIGLLLAVLGIASLKFQ